MSCSPTDPMGCVSDIVTTASSDAFSSIALDFAKWADQMTAWLWTQLDSSTSVQLGGAGFNTDLGIVAAITGTVALGLFLIQIITAAVRRDSSALTRSLKGLMVAFLGGGAAVATTNILLLAIDQLCVGVVKVATGQTISGVGNSILGPNAIQTATPNPAGLLLLAAVTYAAVFIVWAALMVRKVLIIVSAVFAPLAFAGSIADITVSWTRRWVEFMVALIVSKLILVLIFVIGLGVLAEGTGQAGSGVSQIATQAVSGVLIMALAGFSPWLALKLVHFTGDHFQHMHAMAANSATGIRQAADAPQKVASVAAKVGGAAAGDPTAAMAGSMGSGGGRPGGGGLGGSLSPIGSNSSPGGGTATLAPVPSGTTAGGESWSSLPETGTDDLPGPQSRMPSLAGTARPQLTPPTDEG